MAPTANLFRSADSGETWSALHLGAGRLAIDPRSPATSLGRQRRRPRQARRSRRHLDMGPDQPDRLRLRVRQPRPGHALRGFVLRTIHLMATGTTATPTGGSIFVSRDLGATWTRGEQDLGAIAIALAADPFLGGGVYAGTAGTGVFRSDDGGMTWVGSSRSTPHPLVVSGLVADPVRPGHVYALADGTVYRSLDYARTWEPFAEGLVAPAVTALSITPDGRRLVRRYGRRRHFRAPPGSDDRPFVPLRRRGRPAVSRRRPIRRRRRGPPPTRATPGARERPTRSTTGRATSVCPRSTGDPAFPEVIVKMLGPGALGPGGPGIFHASLTTLPYVLTVTDTVTGAPARLRIRLRLAAVRRRRSPVPRRAARAVAGFRGPVGGAKTAPSRFSAAGSPSRCRRTIRARVPTRAAPPSPRETASGSSACPQSPEIPSCPRSS